MLSISNTTLLGTPILDRVGGSFELPCVYPPHPRLPACDRAHGPGQQAKQQDCLELEIAPWKRATGGSLAPWRSAMREGPLFSPLSGAVFSGNWRMFRRVHECYEELTGHRWGRDNVRTAVLSSYRLSFRWNKRLFVVIGVKAMVTKIPETCVLLQTSVRIARPADVLRPVLHEHTIRGHESDNCHVRHIMSG